MLSGPVQSTYGWRRGASGINCDVTGYIGWRIFAHVHAHPCDRGSFCSAALEKNRGVLCSLACGGV